MANVAALAGDAWTTSEVAFAEAQEGGFDPFEENSFIAQPDISIDYAVMEKAKKYPWCPLALAGQML